MPSWLFILLLALALGAFLYILRQLGQVKSLLAARPPAVTSEPDEPRTEAIQVVAPALDPAVVQAGLDALTERVESVQQELRVLALEVRGTRASAGEATSDGPEVLALRHLDELGCTQIQVTSKRAEADSIRFVVKARRGDELLMGHVVVRDDAVIDSNLEVPSALFP